MDLDLVEQNCRQKLRSPPQSPPFVFLHNKEDNKMAFCSLNQIKDYPNNLVETTNRDLLGKNIQKSCHGWLILHKKDESNNHCHHYSLWNPLTFEFICFPPLVLRPEQEIWWSILTAPAPREGKIILYDKEDQSFIFCNIGDKIWTHQLIQPLDLYEDDNWFYDPVMCNGVLYCRGARRPYVNLVEIDVISNRYYLSFIGFYETKPPIDQEKRSSLYFGSMLESCGELFAVELIMGGLTDQKVIAAVVLRLDFSRMEWKNVESLKDRAFFYFPLGGSCSCSAIGCGIKGNHIYFTFSRDKSIYSLDMDDEAISVSLSSRLHSPVLVLPALRNVNTKNSDLDYGGNERKFDDGNITTKEDTKGENFEKLNLDIVFEIGKRLILGDYTTFRALNRKCRLACPSIQWTSAERNGLEDYNLLLPWLTFWKKRGGICNVIDPWHGQFMSIPDNSLRDITMCHSRSGWCVMLGGGNSIFLWNPLTKKIIPLPDLPYDCKFIVTCTLSPAVNWVALIGNFDLTWDLTYINLEEGVWYTFDAFEEDDFPMGTDNNMVSYYGSFYLFNMKGNLGVLETVEVAAEAEGGEVEHEYRWNFRLLDKLKPPCDSFHECFLMECEGELFSVFVGFLGEWVKVFTLDFSNMVWMEIENLRKKTVFVSRFSSFFITSPKSEMENRIYFPRYRDKHTNVIYYSMDSRKMHTHGTEEILENFNNTTEQISSSWVDWF